VASSQWKRPSPKAKGQGEWILVPGLGKRLTWAIVKLGQAQRKKAWGIEHEEKKKTMRA